VINILFSSLEQGLAYGLMALGVYLTFRVLDFPDLTVDGSFPLGAAITSRLIISGMNPVLATVISILLGAGAGLITGILNTKLKITGLLAGILTMTALYSINLRVMGRPNLALLREPTILRMITDFGIPREYTTILVFGIIVLAVKLLVDYFLHTELGMAVRATGDNPKMISSLGVNTDLMIILGLALANGLTALSGAMVAQYQGFADAGMGIGMIIIGLASVIIGESIIRTRKIILTTVGVILGSVVYRFAVSLALRIGFTPTDLKLITAILVIIALSAPEFGIAKFFKNITSKIFSFIFRFKGEDTKEATATDVNLEKHSEDISSGSDK